MTTTSTLHERAGAAASQALAANRDMTAEERAVFQEAVDGARVGTVESEILAVYRKRLTTQEDNRAAEATAMRLHREANEKLEHQRRRPERWAALSETARILYLAVDRSDGPVRKLILDLLVLLDQDTASMPPPESFERTDRYY